MRTASSAPCSSGSGCRRTSPTAPTWRRCSCTAGDGGAGIGAALLQAAEETALAAGKTLLVLDTASADAERLYTRAGWVRVGVVPGFALEPDGAPCDTTYFYRQLSG